MINKILSILTVDHIEILIVLGLFSTVLKLLQLANIYLLNGFNIDKMDIALALLHQVQRYISYYFFLVIGHITDGFLNIDLPYQMVPYLIELNFILHLIRSLFSDKLAINLLDSIISTINKHANVINHKSASDKKKHLTNN
jgi:hypothetical protein